MANADRSPSQPCWIMGGGHNTHRAYLRISYGSAEVIGRVVDLAPLTIDNDIVAAIVVDLDGHERVTVLHHSLAKAYESFPEPGRAVRWMPTRGWLLWAASGGGTHPLSVITHGDPRWTPCSAGD